MPLSTVPATAMSSSAVSHGAQFLFTSFRSTACLPQPVVVPRIRATCACAMLPWPPSGDHPHTSPLRGYILKKQLVHNANDDWHNPLCKECSLQNVKGTIISCVPFAIEEHDLERHKLIVKPARTQIVQRVFQTPPMLESVRDRVLREMNLSPYQCPRTAVLALNLHLRHWSAFSLTGGARKTTVLTLNWHCY